MFYTQGVKKDKCNPEHEDDRGRSRTEIFCEVSSLFHSVIGYIVLYTERQKEKKKRFGLKHQSNERFSYIKILLKIYLSTYTNKTSSLFQRNRRKLIKE